jgi:hypothetical protein
MNDKTVSAFCHTCKRPHQITQQIAATFGRDCECDKCVDWAHVRFMQTTGRKLKLSCVPGCRCGAGK